MKHLFNLKRPFSRIVDKSVLPTVPTVSQPFSKPMDKVPCDSDVKTVLSTAEYRQSTNPVQRDRHNRLLTFVSLA
jgi:hypothetical protein